MRIKRFAAALAVVGAILGAGAAFSAPASAAQPGGDVHGRFYGDGIRLYQHVPTSPDPKQNPVNGLAYHTDRETAHCNVRNGIGGVTWVYVTDDTRHISGLAYFTLVTGANHYC